MTDIRVFFAAKSYRFSESKNFCINHIQITWNLVLVHVKEKRKISNRVSIQDAFTAHLFSTSQVLIRDLMGPRP